MFKSTMRSFQPRRKRPALRKPARFRIEGKTNAPTDHPRRPPRIYREAQRLLGEIGTPGPSAFVPDPFQSESLKRILKEDVLVSAPTGSGKTWIALEASKAYLAKGRRVWYATPLKALSNAKYEEFGQVFGPERVGILTGDRKENPDAEVIVGTTEILRNQLYDAMQTGIDLNVDLVVLDEAHYLADPERGVVWEEVSIYLPSRVRLLLLSATISNSANVAAWLTHIRGARCSVVHSETRPVPLHVLFRTPTGDLAPFFSGLRLHPVISSHLKAEKGLRKFHGSGIPDVNRIVETMRQANLLPAIVFLKSRSECDRALQVLLRSPVESDENGFEDAVADHLDSYPELRNHRQLPRLLNCRAGSHHAGQLPAWRLLIEKMMAAGYLEVIFSTSTVAAGVNFPARTVVICQSDRFNGQGFVDLTSTDLHQMTGRAGRRGMDKAGFTLIVPGRYQDLPLLQRLLPSPSEPLQSKIAVNFSMVLNLLLSHDVEGVMKLLGLSFASFQENPKRAAKETKRLVQEFRHHLTALVDLGYVGENGVPTYDGQWAAKLRLDHPLLIAELIRGGEFRETSPQHLAALIAPFVMDKDKEVLISRELWGLAKPLWKRFRKMMKNARPVMHFLLERGFDVPSPIFWPAAAVQLWAEEVEWSELTAHVKADEGDLAMLIFRTADHVRQLMSLEKEEPELASAAREALPRLMRSPLI